MGNVRLPKPTPLGWCAAAGIAAAASTMVFLVLHNPILAAAIGVLGAVAFVLAGPPPESKQVAPAPEAAGATVPAPRTEAVPARQPVAVAAATAAVPSPLTDPLDQVSLLSAYLQEETSSYQPSYAPEAQPSASMETATLISRVPGQTLTVSEPDPLANAFTGPGADATVEMAPAGSWRIGVDILPQSRSSAVAVGDRLGSFRSAVLKARREATVKQAPGRHRAG